MNTFIIVGEVFRLLLLLYYVFYIASGDLFEPDKTPGLFEKRGVFWGKPCEPYVKGFLLTPYWSEGRSHVCVCV